MGFIMDICEWCEIETEVSYEAMFGGHLCSDCSNLDGLPTIEG